MKRAIQLVVEGDGDLRAAPVLLRRILEAFQVDNVAIPSPHKRGDLPKVKAEFGRFVRVAQKEEAPILWLLDFDCRSCECVKEENKNLKERATVEIGAWPLEICFMVKEYETLFLADEQMTRRYFEIPPAIAWPMNPEQIRDAKGTLSKLLPKGQSYKPTLHQDKLSARINLAMDDADCPSLGHLKRAVARLVEALPNEV
jgi:hypothetical protein